MKKHIHLLKRNTLALAGILMISSSLFSSCKKNGATPDKPANTPIMFTGTAKPSADNVNTHATGNLTAKFDPSTKMLSYTFQWKGLTGKIGGFHIHKGDGSIIIDFKDASYSTDTSGTFSGSSTLTDDSWIQDLKAGKLYGQIHTA
ncbi:MAG TPA: CHRD domain-containing protein, partial [Chitinophagaceae bacterium]|nr:CHRD domain-containing protein [Chitinophagaceae bacterium]